MKLIIDIPKYVYDAAKEAGWVIDADNEKVAEAITKSIILPEWHEKLIVLSENKIKENQIDLDFSCQKWISEVGLSFATVAIIKADKTKSED